MRARNLCGFEIHMELFFVNEFKKKKENSWMRPL